MVKVVTTKGIHTWEEAEGWDAGNLSLGDGPSYRVRDADGVILAEYPFRNVICIAAEEPR
jgi:hypothetical protein